MAGDTPTFVAELHGRSITDLLRAVARLWGLYRITLSPVFPPAVVSALDTLAASIGVLEALNEPGPQ
jgi:hypothetical protein